MKARKIVARGTLPLPGYIEVTLDQRLELNDRIFEKKGAKWTDTDYVRSWKSETPNRLNRWCGNTEQLYRFFRKIS